jgi:hypothetical protein
MPGFNPPPKSVQHGGLDAPNGLAETKRKHRWIFTMLGEKHKNACVYLSTAQRPHLTFEEPVMHHDQEVAYFAGKQTWEPITLVFYDTLNPTDTSVEIYEWLYTVCNLENVQVSDPGVYKKTTELGMTDGNGEIIENWTFYHSWPKEVNWNELDYGNTEIGTIDVIMRFDRALKTFP